MDPNLLENKNMEDSSGDVRPQRNIKLTDKGQEHFEDLSKSHQARIAKAWNTLDICLKSIDKTREEMEELLALHTEIKKLGTELETQCSDYLQFLNRHNSDNELELFNRTLRGYRLMVDTSLRKLTLKIEDLKFRENASRSSKPTISSHNLSQSSAVLRKRAKAEALKASLKFAEDQALLQKRQVELTLRHAITDKENAELTAEMNLLSIKREALELEVEAQVLENDESRSIKSVLENLETENSQKRTSAYVQNISSTCNETQPVTVSQNQPTVEQQNESETPQPLEVTSSSPHPAVTMTTS
ncbi:uncharacterized protein LOC125659772 [Ostrea edulis]|uniref:uncharacterized protein LOC125659772 n=1 Tax=Ostrea edulis TaxID=37623 RepID=UPI0024AF3AFE|nr:uncharacterized protein LOC125659772 [Ostrea edulis]